MTVGPDRFGSRVRSRIGSPGNGDAEYRRAVADNWHSIGLPPYALAEIKDRGVELLSGYPLGLQ